MNRFQHEALNKNLSEALFALKHNDLEKAQAHLRTAQTQVQTQILPEPDRSSETAPESKGNSLRYCLTIFGLDGEISCQYQVLANPEMDKDLAASLAYIHYLKKDEFDEQDEEWEELVQHFGVDPFEKPVGFCNFWFDTVHELDGTNMTFFRQREDINTIDLTNTKIRDLE